MLLAIMMIGSLCMVVSLAPAAVVHVDGAQDVMHIHILESALRPAPM